MKKTFEELLEIGQAKEHLINDYLMDSGMAILPLYQFKYQNECPYVIKNGKKYKLPDLIMLSNMKTCFFESKYKTRWAYDDLTGFNLYQWHNYLDIYDAIGIDITFYFLHEREDMESEESFLMGLDNETGLFTGMLSEMREHTIVKLSTKHTPLALFRKSDLVKVCNLHEFYEKINKNKI